MKAEILKIAGVKSEKEFYKKYPTEEAFQKAHGKEFRKAKFGKAVPKAQDGLLEFMKDKKNCRGASWKPGCGGDSGSGNDAMNISNAPVTSKELTASGYTMADKKKIKQRAKDLQTDFPGISTDDVAMAMGDSARVQAKFPNLPIIDKNIAKYNELKGQSLNEAHRYLPYSDYFFNYYRPYVSTDAQGKPSPLTVPEILSTHSSPQAYKATVNKNYKQRKGGETKKLQQLTDFGNPPVAQIGAFIGGDAPNTMPDFINHRDLYNAYDKTVTGLTDTERADIAYKQAQLQQKSQDKSGGGGPDISGMLNQLGGIMGGTGGGAAMAKRGKKVHKMQIANPPGGGIGLNAGTSLNGQPSGAFDWTAGSGDITGQQSMPTMPGGNAQGMFTMDPNQTGTLEQQIAGSQNAVNPNKKSKTKNISKYFGLAGKVYEGVQALREEKHQRKLAESTAKISDLTLQAASSRPEQIKRRYLFPQVGMSGGTGVGTNYLAKDGTTISQIGGNPTEIQNMYNPGDLYSDLGYEPMSDSDIIKQYRQGGYYRMQTGGATPWDQIGQLGSGIGSAATGDNAGGDVGGDIGGAVGEAAGNIIAPGVGGAAGKAIGQTLGTITGGLLDKNKRKMKAAQERTKANLEKAAFQSGSQAIQARNNVYMEEGGWVSHDWQPQVITQFGEYDMQDLLKRDPMMDTLRTGGHITQNNMFPTDQYALGGELKTTWGGYAEPISHNPYMPGTGETVMFRGKSHEESDGNGHTGIGVKYGEGGHDSYTDYAEYGSREADADVEVERGEPATEMVDPKTGEKNMVVFGNLQIPNHFLDQIGDKNAKGKKFKNYIADLGKDEAKQNKIIEKATNTLDGLEVYTPFDKLKFDALQATIEGANMKLKEAALRKSNASAVQNAINETAEEHGIDADALAKGKYKIDKEAMKQQAKYGKELFKAQNGTTGDYGVVGPTPIPYLKRLYESAKKEGKGKTVEFFQKEFNRFYPDIAKDVILKYPTVTSKAKKKYKINTPAQLSKKDTKIILDTNVDKTFGPRTEAYNVQLDKLGVTPYPKQIARKSPDFKINVPTIPPGITPSGAVKTPKKEGFDWMTYANQALEYLRPSDQEEFDYSQVYPEMAALAMNQLEPVQAQLYRPDLGTPMDISLQDQLNANQADFNAIQRQTGYNPEALSALAAQKYAANSKVLADQFRLNQAEKQRVYEGNRALLNDAQLKNLGILDTQMVRQEEAKSRTKQQAIEAMKSVADKIAKNKLENRTLGIYENLYKYRFDPSGRAINMNPLAQFSPSGSGATSDSLPAIPGYEWDNTPTLRKKKKSEDTGRNGKIVKAIKNL
jgi:hypothetical protein